MRKRRSYNTQTKTKQRKPKQSGPEISDPLCSCKRPCALERETGFGPATFALARRRSTTEPFPQTASVVPHADTACEQYITCAPLFQTVLSRFCKITVNDAAAGSCMKTVSADLSVTVRSASLRRRRTKQSGGCPPPLFFNCFCCFCLTDTLAQCVAAPPVYGTIPKPPLKVSLLQSTQVELG